MTIPRENTDYVQTILNDDKLDTHGKAAEIHKYDYECLCREYDRMFDQMSREDIRQAILDREVKNAD